MTRDVLRKKGRVNHPKYRIDCGDDEKVNNAETIDQIKCKIEQLIREKQDLDQMQNDARELSKIRRLIVHEPFD